MKKAIFIFCLLIGFCVTQSKAQGKDKCTLKLTVLDSTTNDKLPGVMVVIQGTNNRQHTNILGSATIKNIQKNSKIIIDYFGFRSDTITVVKDTTQTIKLQPKFLCVENMLEESISEDMPAYVDVHSDTKHPGKEYSNIGLSESYTKFTPNKFQNPLNNPLSTFSIDIDAASYTNMRRMINLGVQVPSESIRSEELINFFKYNYPKPSGEDIVAISTQVNQCPWNTQNRLVKIGVQAKELDKSKLPQSNIILLIDVSGSMSSKNKLPLAKSALAILVDKLRDDDMVSVITYASGANVALDPTPGKEKTQIMNAINTLSANGSTAGGEALKLAYKTAKENFIKNGNNRIVLLTDGDFNVGESSDEAMEELVKKESTGGVFLSVLGFGMGNYKDSKMQAIAQNGNGNAMYVDNMDEASRVLSSEFGGTMFTIAKDVKIQVEFNPRLVQGYRLIGYETRKFEDEDFNNDIVDAGEMGIGHTATALYEVVPVGVKSNMISSVDKLKYQTKDETKSNTTLNQSNELLTVKLRYKNTNSDQSTLIEQSVIDKNEQLSTASDDFKFAAAVAAFGMLLTNSPFINKFDKNSIIELAQKAKGTDTDGYRAEFVRLIKNANYNTNDTGNKRM